MTGNWTRTGELGGSVRAMRGPLMTRDEFIAYLAPRAEVLGVPLQRAGELAGLPRDFHQALAFAHLLDALGRPAPSTELLRIWYGKGGSHSPAAARWVYRVVGSLRDPDLRKLTRAELVSFWVRFDTWGATASALARDRRRKPPTAH